jgi:hypothetical protein
MCATLKVSVVLPTPPLLLKNTRDFKVTSGR